MAKSLIAAVCKGKTVQLIQPEKLGAGRFRRTTVTIHLPKEIAENKTLLALVREHLVNNTTIDVSDQ